MINVNIIRVFEGERHEKLRFIWDTIAEYCADKIRLHWYANPNQISHSRCLDLLWSEELQRPEPFALITEHDFLPDFSNWLCAPLSDRYPLITAEYVTRDPKTRKLAHHKIPGAWYMMIDKTQIGELDFAPAGPFNDPANGLQDYVSSTYSGRGVMLLKNHDCYPEHYGTELLTGTHLFWSRHLHDPENTRIAGFCLGDIQKAHDLAVRKWIFNSPKDFQKLLACRAPAALLSE